MKAMYLNKKGGAESLVFGEIPTPRPADNEVLVKVHATAVMPTELQWFPTFNLASGQPRPFPIVLSHEFSGVVESLGATATGFKIGDAVIGLNDWFINGAQAEYCVVAANALALKPNSLDHAQAAVVPISALTAWQGLFDHASLQNGQRVLIHGASGGVGTFAVQLAHSRGAHVIATASGKNIEFVRALGAAEVIDYHAARFEAVARDIDVVFDGVGGETLDRSWSVLKPGGKLVTFATGGSDSKERRVRDAFFLVKPDGSQLSQIGNLIDAGMLRVFTEEVFPLEQAREAYERAQHGHPRGKIALQVIV